MVNAGDYGALQKYSLLPRKPSQIKITQINRKMRLADGWHYQNVAHWTKNGKNASHIMTQHKEAQDDPAADWGQALHSVD